MNVVRYRYWTLGFSAVLIIIGVAFWIIGGLKIGIDFTGGTLMRVTLPDVQPSVSDVSAALEPLALDELRIQPSGDHDIILRMPHIDNETRSSIIERLSSVDSSVQEQSFETVGPTIGKELKDRSIVAVIFVLIGIIIYIAWAFRSVSRNSPVSSWVWGASAIIALAHDVLIVIGTFAVLGYFLDIEIDVLFITALLTILGFSVHDTIVVFDRIRERLRIARDDSFDDTVNVSVQETLTRSINTSSTTLFVLLALLLFGGTSVQYFILALVVGLIAGTYSSIFIASPLLVVWKRMRNR